MMLHLPIQGTQCVSDTAIHDVVVQHEYILIIKPKRCTNFKFFFFGIELYMFQTGFLSIIRSLVLYTQQQVYVIQILLTAC